MSTISALRTYTLKSPESATSFSGHFKLLAATIKQNHNVYLSRSNLNRALALVQYPAGRDPEKVVGEFVQSEAFKKDREGFDLSGLAGTTEDLLNPVEF